MRCEVCGQKVFGKPQRAMIEGARLTVCGKCAKHGKILQERSHQKPVGTKLSTSRRYQPRVRPTQGKQRITKQTVESPLELVEDFAVRIRQARENLKLSHEDLGRRISEKVSVLKKIETGKMTPNNMLAARLEHTLKIKLFAPTSEEKITQTKVTKAIVTEMTLGDLVDLREESSEEKE